MRSNSASAQVERRLGVHHVRHARRIERLAGGQPEPRFDLRALASASCSCADVSVGEMRTSTAPCATRVPRSTGVAIDAAGGLGADFGLLVGDQRAGDAQVAIDRPALDRGDRDRRRGSGWPAPRGRRCHVGAARRPQRAASDERRRHENENVLTVMIDCLTDADRIASHGYG